jgi:hypothetical protein
MNEQGQWCPRKFWPVALLLGIYLLIGNILLVNLLIAIFRFVCLFHRLVFLLKDSLVFSHVFEDVHVNSLEIWKFEMYALATEFDQMPILPPPLTVLENFFEAVLWLMPCNRRHGICGTLIDQNLNALFKYCSICSNAVDSATARQLGGVRERMFERIQQTSRDGEAPGNGRQDAVGFRKVL